MGLGALLGLNVGLVDGTTVKASGESVGMIDGVSDSIMDGTALALELGCCVGIRLVDGILVGAIDGN